MCCFSGPVAVSGTNIFCRHVGAKQLIAYQMKYATDAEVAMVLPIPTPAGTAENAVRFIDLSGYESLFEDLNAAFEVPTRGGSFVVMGASSATLQVHDVGAYDASFVPSRRDFARLDERFRLPDRVWASLPLYEDWGFAVFKLKPTSHVESSIEEVTPRSRDDGSPPPPPVFERVYRRAGQPELHPMAFEFPTRAPDQVFFPTVHIHDGQVHEYATFDHWLYLQLPEGQRPQSTVTDRFSPAERSPDATVKLAKTRGLVTKDPLYRLRYAGEALNEDIWAPIVR